MGDTDNAVWGEWDHTKDTADHDIYERGSIRIEVYDDRRRDGWRALAYEFGEETRTELAAESFEDEAAAREHARATAQRLANERF